MDVGNPYLEITSRLLVNLELIVRILIKCRIGSSDLIANATFCEFPES